MSRAVATWNPWEELRHFRALTGLPEQQVQDALLPLDVFEEAGSLVIRAALPGFSRDQIKVSVEGRVLRIEAAHSEESEQQDRRWFVREVRSGRTSRALRLPNTVDARAAETRFEDGLLTLRLPRKEDETRFELPLA